MTPIERVRAALDTIECGLSYYVHLATKAKTNNKWIQCELYKVEEAIDQLVKIRRELSGKVLVPVEPDALMLEYGFMALQDPTKGHDETREIYRAMIAPYVKGGAE